VFAHPEDKGAMIWRYMDFTKYVSMLEHGGLYLRRSDLLGDPFEGSVSQLNLQAERAFFTGGHMPGLPKEVAEDFLRRQSDNRRAFRKLMYLNCWYLSDVESAAMLYGRSEPAIAIQSSFSSLFNSLPETHYVGLISYIDYRTGFVQGGNLFHPFLCKRRSFAHENEIRVVHSLPAEPGQHFLDRDTPEGIWTSVKLPMLISRVFVSPNSPSWFRELLENVSKKYGLDRTVLQSDLDTSPVF
jgi:hypothetical protein